MSGSDSVVRLKHELAAIKNYLIAAQDVVASGHMPDLTGLENRIALLCQSIQKTEPAVQKECLPELTSLLDHLNLCEKGMRTSHEAKMAKGDHSQ